jgi:tetratricopeptide (TPR) repeat protein
MYRMILTFVAALTVAILPRPAAAVDQPIVCLNERGDAAIAACRPVLPLRPNSVAGARGSVQGLLAQRSFAAPSSAPSADISECANVGDDVARRLDACTRAIAANPGNNRVLLPAYMARASLYQTLKQWDRVVADCDEALRIGPPVEMRATTEGLRRAALAIMQRSNPGAPGGAAAVGQGIGGPAGNTVAVPHQPLRPGPGLTATASPSPSSGDISECVNAGDDVARRLDACTRAIAVNPGNNRVLLPAYMARASLYQKLKQWDRVVADCDEALRIGPPGEMRATTEGLRRAALAILERRAPGAPPDPASSPAQSTTQSADLTRCIDLAGKDVAGRLDACTRAIDANPGNNDVLAPAHMARALLYQGLKQWDRVIADCDEVLRLAPEGEMRSAADILRGVAAATQQANPGAQANVPAQAAKPSADGAACADDNGKDEAIAACNRLLALNPKDAAAYNHRGRAYGRKEDYDRAIADLDQAIRLDPKYAGTGTQFGLSVTYYSRAVTYVHRQEFDRAIADLDQAIRFDAKNALLYASRGSVYGNKGDYERAVADYDRAIRLDPKQQHWADFAGVGAVAYSDRAEAYEGNNDPDHALADFEQALQLDPSLAAARRGRERVAALLAQRSKPQPTTDLEKCRNEDDELPRRLEACTRAIEANFGSKTDLVLAHMVRANLYAKLRQFDRVIADADDALRLNPPAAFVSLIYSLRGIALRQRHEYDRALADYDKAVSPSNVLLADAYWGRGYVYLNMANYERARADLDKAISLKPSTTAYRIRAELRLEQDDDAGALADLTEGLRRDPQDADCYAVRAEYYVRMGKLREARADADKALAIRPESAMVHATRGWIALAEGRIEVALGELTEAIDIEPGPATVAHRGMAYERSGRADRAIADYRRVLELAPSSRMGREAQEAARQRIAALANAPASQPAVPVPAAPPGRRIALVIGMGAYANVGTLRNPTSDARAIADVFRRLGFAEVIEREDLTRAKLEEVLKEFGDKAAEADWAIIYYAGHGVEMNGENYLVPVDAKLTRAEHVEDEAVTLKRVLAKTEAAHKLRMVILDACRSNPFRMADAGSRGIGRGLLPVEPARGVMVAYAARDGTTADDGNSGHSPYTQALLANLETPGIDIRIMFGKVRDQVLTRTNNNQEPFTYGSLPGEEFYFKDATR